jgi:outer membrane protein OmpA-like peptidoglycan-associated protein
MSSSSTFQNHSNRLQEARAHRILFRALGISAAVLALYTLNACTVTREYAGDGKRGEEKQERAEKMEQAREKTQEMAHEGMSTQAPGMAAEQARAQLAEWREKVQTATVQLGEKLRFSTGSSDLNAEAREELRQLSGLLAQQPTEKLRLKGYTDSRGSVDVNQLLAQQRVEAVRSELINQGVAADQIEIMAAGEASPVATNTTAAGRAKNRRVEVEVMSPPSG